MPPLPQIKDYQIHQPALGEGAFGTVYHATYRGISDRAVKVFKPDSVDLPTMARELEKLSSMAEHPGIVTLHDFDLVAETPYYAMSLHCDEMPDGSWRSRTLEDLCGKVDAKEAADLIEQIATAMSYLHRHQVLHCDLKPSNILLTDESPPRIRICDFGQSRGAARNSPEAAGTPLYSSPEQLLKPDDSAEGAGFRWDVYSFGVVAYKLVTGKLPRLQQLLDGREGSESEYEDSILDQSLTETSLTGTKSGKRSEKIAELLFEEDEIEWPANAAIDNRRKAIITQCLSLDRTERPADMRDVRGNIRRAVEEQRVTRQRNWTLLFGAITVTALLATGLAGLEAYRARQAIRSEQEARKGAEELVRYILGDLRDKLTEKEQFELLEHIAQNADTYVNSLSPDQHSSETARTIAIALHAKADVARQRGDAELAAEAYGQLITMYTRFIEAGDDSSRTKNLASQAMIGLGDALFTQSEHKEAIDYYNEALSLRDESLPEGVPARPYYRTSALAHSRIGEAMVQLERYDDAIDSFAEAVRINQLPLNRMDRRQPAADTSHLLRSMNRLAMAHQLNGDDEAAEDEYYEVVRTASKEGNQFGFKQPAAVAFHALGEVDLRAERKFEARRHFEDEHQFREELYKLERSNPLRSLELAHCLMSLGSTYSLTSDANRKAARGHYQRAIELTERVRNQPGFESAAQQLLEELMENLEAIAEAESDVN